MFFTRTHKYQCSLPRNAVESRLISKQVTIRDMHFEVFEKDAHLRIVPHAEQTTPVKTLPITKVDLKHEDGQTKVVVTSHMRKLDLGGPQLVMLFCAFLFLASFTLFYVGGDKQITYTLLGISTGIFTIFWIRLEMGYFDYVRKISSYVKNQMELAV